jgi:hypothetical protein
METVSVLDTCDTLLNYYNTSVLTNADSTFKRALFDEATKCADEHPIKRVEQPSVDLERTVLKKLIINKEINDDPSQPALNKKPIIECIGGPYTLTMHWSKVYKKLIYIFGEVHYNLTSCSESLGKDKKMNIEKYLTQFFKNTDVFYDFYLEIRAFNKQRGDYGFQFTGNGRIIKIMMETENYVQKCIQSRTRNTSDECQLGRMHFFDTRENENVKINNASVFSKKFNELHKEHIIKVLNKGYKEGIDDPSKKFLKVESDIRYKTLLDNFFKNEHVRTCITEFSKIENIEQYYDFWYKEFNNYEFNIEKIKKSVIGEKIIDFINDQIKLLFFNKDIINIAKGIVKNINYVETTSDIITTSDYLLMVGLLEEVSEFLIDANYLVIDGYLLARVFKDFDINSVDIQKQRPTDEPKSPHNIIIYAGDKHCTTYRKFLEDVLDFTLIEEAGVKWRKQETDKTITFSSDMNDPPNHIDMGEFPQPFFSHHPIVDWTFDNTKSDEMEESYGDEIETDDYDYGEISGYESLINTKRRKKSSSPKSAIGKKEKSKSKSKSKPKQEDSMQE